MLLHNYDIDKLEREILALLQEAVDYKVICHLARLTGVTINVIN